MICPILTAAMMTILGQPREVVNAEVNAEVECYREDCSMWPLCRQADHGYARVSWIKDAVLTGIPEPDAEGSGCPVCKKRIEDALSRPAASARMTYDEPEGDH